MTNEEAAKAFEKRNFWLNANHVCQSIPERVKKQQNEIERNSLAIVALQARYQIKNELLTVEQLQKRKSPVWCRVDDCSWIPDGGYWCLCNGGVIVAPSGQMFKCEAIQNWKLYDHRPEVQQ